MKNVSPYYLAKKRRKLYVHIPERKLKIRVSGPYIGLDHSAGIIFKIFVVLPFSPS